MYDLLSLDVVESLLSQSAFYLVWLAMGLLVYGAIADRVLFDGTGRVHSGSFGAADVFIGAILGTLFVALIASGWRNAIQHHESHEKLPDAAAVIAEVAVSTLILAVVIGGILTSLKVRGASWRDAFGLTRVGVGGVFARGALLLALALPLIYAALAIFQVLLAAGGGESQPPQEIVRFLADSPSAVAKGVVAVSAIMIAPLQEEFIFRGYLYGIVRRYAGVAPGLLVNATLFAGIHLHAPSFGGLFVLAACLTLAYEWTGSLLVPMAMHALFNSLSIVHLLAGGSADG